MKLQGMEIVKCLWSLAKIRLIQGTYVKKDEQSRLLYTTSTRSFLSLRMPLKQSWSRVQRRHILMEEFLVSSIKNETKSLNIPEKDRNYSCILSNIPIMLQQFYLKFLFKMQINFQRLVCYGICRIYKCKNHVYKECSYFNNSYAS
ncbi:hypothetical protein TorRG33x02_247470 [Trema orientale]|uniref:Uncharacterized protein n=1 Tax=Trema orientale TaxID=63057 RepID=A0A2P5DLL6_TREOI|nr:hypothetical protein TorRG33x02_247470 [Trema orientale]